MRCGYLGWVTCNPVTCSVANPGQCVRDTTTTATTTEATTTTSTESCESGYTKVGDKCFKLGDEPAKGNFYQAIIFRSSYIYVDLDKTMFYYIYMI